MSVVSANMVEVMPVSVGGVVLVILAKNVLVQVRRSRPLFRILFQNNTEASAYELFDQEQEKWFV